MDAPATPWLSLLMLGAAHGINPAMGWLFAVGSALQQRDRRAIWRALGPLAAGHALAVSVAVLLAMMLGQLLPLTWLRWITGAALLAVGVDGLVRHRHVRLAGMRVSARELGTWSFLMASAHGAGLMVVPFILGARSDVFQMGDAFHHDHLAGSQQAALLVGNVARADAIGITAPVVHTLGYLAMTVVLAVIVYEKVGLRILRRAWINLDAIWAAALIAAAIAAMLP